VRRHRLAEKLFEESFEMPEALSGREACRFEHILSREVANTICTFLAHPTACPHGKPIPAGECCANSPVSAGD
jgi:DtxR family Mn-dependent transcriptional regulator